MPFEASWGCYRYQAVVALSSSRSFAFLADVAHDAFPSAKFDSKFSCACFLLRLHSQTYQHKNKLNLLLSEKIFCYSCMSTYSIFFLRITTPSMTVLTGIYFSVPNSARSPTANKTGVVCVWNPVILLGRPA